MSGRAPRPRRAGLPSSLTRAGGGARFAVLAARFHEPISKKLVDGALHAFAAAHVPAGDVEVHWVPGSFEIPLAAQRMAASGRYAAVLCLGAVIRGETSHDLHINRAVSLAISQLALSTNVPVLFGVLTCETMEQAIDRAGGNVGNKGAECAEAALHMVGLLNNLPGGMTNARMTNDE